MITKLHASVKKGGNELRKQHHITLFNNYLNKLNHYKTLELDQKANAEELSNQANELNKLIHFFRLSKEKAPYGNTVDN